MEPSPSDAAIIAESLRDPDAFVGIFDRHSSVVSRYLTRRVGVDLAQDLTVETFLIAFRRRARYQTDRPDARPWLLGIASNLASRHWRSERRRLVAYARAASPATREHDESSYVDTAVSLTAGLAKMGQRDREALLLHVWAGLSYSDIAQALDIPMGTVKSRIGRARRVLREQLADSGESMDREG